MHRKKIVKTANLTPISFVKKKRKWRAPRSDCRTLQPQASLRRPGGQAPRACTPPPGIGRPRSHSAPTRQGSRSLPPPAPSPRAWQEKRATWSGNKGPRGPPRSETPRSGAGATSLQARGTEAARGRLPPPRAGSWEVPVGESRPGQTHAQGVGSNSGNGGSRALARAGPRRAGPGAPSRDVWFPPPCSPAPATAAAASETQPPRQGPESGAPRGQRRRLGFPPGMGMGPRSAPPAPPRPPSPSRGCRARFLPRRGCGRR